jgi:hypothetical protein
MQPHRLGLGDQIADGQYQPVVDHDAVAGALGPQGFRAGGVGGDDRVQTDHRGQHAIEIETVVVGAGLIRRRHFPFSQRGHGDSPGEPARVGSLGFQRTAARETGDDLMSQKTVLKVSRNVIVAGLLRIQLGIPI